MFCNKCGSQIQEGQKFCTKCGAAAQPTVNQQNAYQQNGYQQNGYQQNSYQQNGYQQGGYRPNPYNRGPRPNDGKGFSIAALVLGCCSAALSLILAASFPISLLFLACGIAGIVLGVMGRQRSIAAYGRPSGMATAGFVLSIIGTALSALFILSCLACYYACANSTIGLLL